MKKKGSHESRRTSELAVWRTRVLGEPERCCDGPYSIELDVSLGHEKKKKITTHLRT